MFQGVTAARAVLIAANHHLEELVHQIPDILLLIAALHFCTAPRLITVQNGVFLQTTLLQLPDKFLEVVRTFRKWHTAQRYFLTEEAVHLTIKEMSNNTFVESKISQQTTGSVRAGNHIHNIRETAGGER